MLEQEIEQAKNKVKASLKEFIDPRLKALKEEGYTDEEITERLKNFIHRFIDDVTENALKEERMKQRKQIEYLVMLVLEELVEELPAE